MSDDLKEYFVYTYQHYRDGSLSNRYVGIAYGEDEARRLLGRRRGYAVDTTTGVSWDVPTTTRKKKVWL